MAEQVRNSDHHSREFRMSKMPVILPVAFHPVNPYTGISFKTIADFFHGISQGCDHLNLLITTGRQCFTWLTSYRCGETARASSHITVSTRSLLRGIAGDLGTWMVHRPDLHDTRISR